MNAAPTAADLPSYLPLLLSGIPVTLEVTGAATVLVVLFGFLFGMCRPSRYRAIRWPTGAVVEVLRGSSAIVQLFWAYYVLPFFGINLPAFVVGMLVLGLNGGAYFSEVVRAGLAAVPRGQSEAAITLHMSRSFRFRRIILPQAVAVMIPPFGNQLIDMLKFTSLLSLIAIHDLAYNANAIGTTLNALGPVYGLTLLIYFTIAIVLSLLVSVIEVLANRWAGRATRGERVTKASRQSTSNVPRWAFPSLNG